MQMHICMVKPIGCHLQQILPVQMSWKMHFGNPASLNYQLNPSKQVFPSLLGDIEKLDEPFELFFC